MFSRAKKSGAAKSDVGKPEAGKSGTATSVPVPALVEPSKPSSQKAVKKAGLGIPSIVSGDLVVTGNLRSTGDIQVDGRVEGDVISRTITIGEEACVEGSIIAESVRICGCVRGEVKATTVTLAKTGRVEGDIAHESLSIEAGAFIEGSIRRLEPDKAESEARVSFINPVQETTAEPGATSSKAGSASR